MSNTYTNGENSCCIGLYRSTVKNAHLRDILEIRGSDFHVLEEFWMEAVAFSSGYFGEAEGFLRSHVWGAAGPRRVRGRAGGAGSRSPAGRGRSRFRGKGGAAPGSAGGAEPRPAPEAAAGGAGRGGAVPRRRGRGKLGEPFWGAGPERGRTWGRRAPPGAVTSGRRAGPPGCRGAFAAVTARPAARARLRCAGAPWAPPRPMTGRSASSGPYSWKGVWSACLPGSKTCKGKGSAVCIALCAVLKAGLVGAVVSRGRSR